MIIFFMVALGSWTMNHGHCDVFCYDYDDDDYYYQWNNVTITLLGGLGISYEKGLGLGVSAPHNNTLVHLFYVIWDHRGPKKHN